MKRNGRPTKYTEELGDKIARHILEGLTIKDACYVMVLVFLTTHSEGGVINTLNLTKKIVEASNRQWENSVAIAKYHSGYRGYKRPKVRLSPDYDANMRKDHLRWKKPSESL